MSQRQAAVSRDTLETQISVSVNLDGSGITSFDTGLPFLEHMLDQVARHGMQDIEVKARGDLHIDGHHTVEDIGITLGQAIGKALADKRGIRRYGHAYVPLDEALSRVVIDFLGQAIGKALADKRGIRRYGHAYVPLDEALSRVVIDFSGRPGLEYHAEFPRARIGDFDVDLLHEFFQGFCNHALVTLHIDCLRGDNAHHIAETIFKAFGRAMRMALESDAALGKQLPSTKGSL